MKIFVPKNPSNKKFVKSKKKNVQKFSGNTKIYIVIIILNVKIRACKTWNEEEREREKMGQKCRSRGVG